MKALFHPVALVFAGVAIVGGVLGSVPLLLAGAALWIGSVAFLASKQAQSNSKKFDLYDLSPDTRILIRPIRQTHDEIAAIVSQNNDNPTVKVIGQEGMAEAEQILEQAIRLGAARTQLEKTLRGRSQAQLDVDRIQSKLVGIGDSQEQASLQSALEAHRAELSHYEPVQNHLESIDNYLREAQAGLAELKARIAVGAAEARMAGAEEGDIGEIMGRLRSLSASFDEAEAITEEVTR